VTFHTFFVVCLPCRVAQSEEKVKAANLSDLPREELERLADYARNRLRARKQATDTCVCLPCVLCVVRVCCVLT